MSRKVFAKRNIDRVDGFDRSRTLNHECEVKPKMQPFSDDTFFTFERKAVGGKGRRMTGDMRVSTHIHSKKHRQKILDLTLRFSPGICDKLGLSKGDHVRARGSVSGIWHVDLSRPPEGNLLCTNHTKNGSLCVRFVADKSEIKALGLDRHDNNIPFIECDFVEIKDDVAVFCAKN